MLATKLLSMFLKNNIDEEGIPHVDVFSARLAEEMGKLYIRRDPCPEVKKDGKINFNYNIEKGLGTEILLLLSRSF